MTEIDEKTKATDTDTVASTNASTTEKIQTLSFQKGGEEDVGKLEESTIKVSFMIFFF